MECWPLAPGCHSATVEKGDQQSTPFSLANVEYKKGCSRLWCAKLSVTTSTAKDLWHTNHQGKYTTNPAYYSSLLYHLISALIEPHPPTILLECHSSSLVLRGCPQFLCRTRKTPDLHAIHNEMQNAVPTHECLGCPLYTLEIMLSLPSHPSDLSPFHLVLHLPSLVANLVNCETFFPPASVG
jgi:hypothetical protein